MPGHKLHLFTAEFRWFKSIWFKSHLNQIIYIQKIIDLYQLFFLLFIYLFICTEEILNCPEFLKGKSVSRPMCIDGWSNIRNEPIICACIITSDGDVYLTETIDTSGWKSDYLAIISKATIFKNRENF